MVERVEGCPRSFIDPTAFKAAPKEDTSKQGKLF
jgi:hypothetical protein